MSYKIGQSCILCLKITLQFLNRNIELYPTILVNFPYCHFRALLSSLSSMMGRHEICPSDMIWEEVGEIVEIVEICSAESFSKIYSPFHNFLLRENFAIRGGVSNTMYT